VKVLKAQTILFLLIIQIETDIELTKMLQFILKINGRIILENLVALELATACKFNATYSQARVNIFM
jgi:hypothetical protein